MTRITVEWAQPECLAPERLKYLAELLDENERVRAGRFVFDADRTAFITAHGMLRLALSAQCGAPPESFCFATLPSGRPVLAGAACDAGVAFSLSHTRSLVACAVSHAASIGIDVEPVPESAPEASLIALACTPAERIALTAQSAESLPRAFAYLWTMKEAVLKAIGADGDMTVAQVECGLDPPRLIAVHAAETPAESWRVDAMMPSPAHVMAVALPASVTPLWSVNGHPQNALRVAGDHDPR